MDVVALAVRFMKRFIRKSTKSTKSTKNHKNATKQKRKTQISEQKLKMRLKNSGKSNLFAYLRFCVFYAREEKKNRTLKSRGSLQCNVRNTNVPINSFRCVCVYLHEPVCGDINLHFNLIKIS